MFHKGYHFGAPWKLITVQWNIEPILPGKMHVIFFGNSFSACSACSEFLNLSDHAIFAKDMQTTSDNGLLDIVETDETVFELVSLHFL